MDVRPVTGRRLAGLQPIKAAAPAARVARAETPPKDEDDAPEDEPLRAATPPGVGENLDILV